MTFVADWDTRSRDRIELYADPHAGDGFVILIGAYAPEHAADITDATESRPESPGSAGAPTATPPGDPSRKPRSAPPSPPGRSHADARPSDLGGVA
ncbi:hypothetical protein GCM10029992_33980 [Glycomyces albus]